MSGIYFHAKGIDSEEEFQQFMKKNERKLDKIVKIMEKLGITWISIEGKPQMPDDDPAFQ